MAIMKTYHYSQPIYSKMNLISMVTTEWLTKVQPNLMRGNVKVNTIPNCGWREFKRDSSESDEKRVIKEG